jgi:tyrosyl-tRNA synthetase
MSGPRDTAEQLELLTKGCVDVVTAADLKARVESGRPMTVKVGFDPTAPDIHLGHTVLMRKMKHFQDCGHRVIFLIGDFTGLIGDPTGRSKTRPPLTREQIDANAETYKRQVFRILDPQRTEIRFNSEWLSALGSEGWVRLAATYNVARMMERRDFRQRYEAGQPISMHEFLYPLAQAYDSVFLRADVELGGTDQLFNLNVGRDIMPAYGLPPQVVMTTALLEGLDGAEKMSKSLGNYIGVTEAPPDMFAKVLSISDPLMWRYYTLLTDLTPREIEAERQRETPLDSKKALARRIVADFHGAAAAQAAEAEWSRIHQQGHLPAEMPESVLEIDGERQEWKPHELLVALGDAPSKSEAVRLLRQRAVRLDGAVIEASAAVVTAPGQEFTVSIGPRRHRRVRVRRRGGPPPG